MAFTLFYLFLAAFSASALGGVLGMASGIFIVPILTVLFGINIHVAIGASIISVIACSCAGSPPFLKQGCTNIRLALVLEVATTAGAVTGVIVAGIASTSFLYGLFALILLVSAKQMLSRRKEIHAVNRHSTTDIAGRLDLHGSYFDSVQNRDVAYTTSNFPAGFTLMYGAGLISALLGIGSGVLKIPAMDSALRLPLKVSSATSTFMIGVTAAASAVVWFVQGNIDFSIAGPVALGSVVGAMLGAKLLMRLPAEKLRIFFALVLFLLSVQMVFSAMDLHIQGYSL